MATLAVSALTSVLPEVFGGSSILEAGGALGTAATAASGAADAGSWIPSWSEIGDFAGAAAKIGGAGLNYYGDVKQAQGVTAEADFNAEQLDEKGNLDAAAGQAAAAQANQKTMLTESRARALAAASGGGVSDPSVVANLGQIGAQGEYNAAEDLYNGQNKNVEDQNQAMADQFAAKQKSQQLMDKGYGSLFGIVEPVTSLLSKYG